MKKTFTLVVGIIMFAMTTFLLFALPMAIKEPFDHVMRVSYTIMMFLGYGVSFIYFLVYQDLRKPKTN